ncbi:MAG: hypothetical protein GX443_04460 [Deltaproteobacteria bacterium]|nr:hypothetical protein [Deltaproteobacteria bacterium]
MLLLSIIVIFMVSVFIMTRMEEDNLHESFALSGSLGIHPSGKWGRVERSCEQQPYGLPTYFEGTYDDTRTTCHRIKVAGAKTNLLRLSLDHPRSLSMGLVCCYRLQPCTFSECAGMSRADVGLEGFTVWAADGQKAKTLFRETDVAASVEEVIRIFSEMEPDGERSPWTGFLMTDREITAYFPEDLTLDRRLISALARLSRAAATSPLVSVPMSQPAERDSFPASAL